MEDKIKEKKIENYPTFVTIEKTKIILDQLQNRICKIKNMKGKGTGFFCKIPFENKNISVLMTNNHLIDEEMLKENHISVSLNDDQEIINIMIDDNRKLYTSEKYDTTIIEIKPEEDEIEIEHFLKIDEDIFQGNLSQDNIYILQYPYNLDEQKAAVTYGILKNKDDNDNIKYCCTTDQGSSGSPILKLSNNKVIGIHKEVYKSNRFNFNIGTFLKEPIIEYINNINIINNKKNNKVNNKLKNENDTRKNNEIRIKLKIEKEDIKKEIYFLSCYLFDSNIDEYSILNQLNESNADLFINEKKYKFQKYFIFEKEGIYSIKIKIKSDYYIKDCQSMFYECRNIIEIDFSSFDTKNVINMSQMFRECQNLTKINLSNFDTQNVTNMKFMFAYCKNLKALDLSSFNTKNVTNIRGMFIDCRSLINLNLSNFDIKNVQENGDIFAYCYKLRKVIVNHESFKKIEEAKIYPFIQIIPI